MMTVEKDKDYEDQIEKMKQKNQQLLERFQATEEDRKKAEDHGSTIKKEQNVSLRMKPEDAPKLRNNRLTGQRPKSFHGNVYHDNQDNQFQNQYHDNRKPNKFRTTKFNEEAVAYQDYRHFQQTHTNKSFNNHNNNRTVYRQSSHSNYSEEPNSQKSNHQEFNRFHNQSMRNRVPPRFAQNYHQNNRNSNENDIINQNHHVHHEAYNQPRMSKDNEFHNHHYPNAKNHRDEFHNSHHVNTRFFKETEVHNQHYSNSKIQKDHFYNHQNSNTRSFKDNEFHNQQFHNSHARMPKDESHNPGSQHPRISKGNEHHTQQYSNTRFPKDDFQNQGFPHQRIYKENDHYYVKIPKEEYYKYEHSEKNHEKDVHNQKINPQNTRNNSYKSSQNQSFKRRPKQKPSENGNKMAVDGSGDSNINSIKKSSAFDDEYIDDTLGDLEKYVLKVDMEDFIVIDPESPDPILAMPLKPWSNSDIVDSIEVNKIDGESQTNEISSHVLNCANERAREYFNLICQNPIDYSSSHADVDESLNIHEKNLTNIQENSQVENISDNGKSNKIDGNILAIEDLVNNERENENVNNNEILNSEKEVETIEKEIKNTTKEIELIENEIKQSTEIVETIDEVKNASQEMEITEKNGNKEVEIMEETPNVNKEVEIIEEKNNANNVEEVIRDEEKTQIDTSENSKEVDTCEQGERVEVAVNQPVSMEQDNVPVNIATDPETV